MSRIRPKYVMKRITLNGRNIGQFFVVDEDHRRKLRTSVVNSLRSDMNAGVHFDSIFVCNYLTNEGIRRITDGNHRWDAIKEQILRDPDFEIDIWYAEYKDLTPLEEKEVFTKWNKGTKQSADDFLKIWFTEIPLGRLMLDRIPASIYNHKRKVKLKTIVGSHIMATRQNPYDGSYIASGMRVVEDFKLITRDDITLMRAFMVDMANVLVEHDMDSPYYKDASLCAIYRIWYDNRTAVEREKLIEGLNFLLVRNRPTRLLYLDILKSNNRESSKTLYGKLVYDLNGLSTTSGLRTRFRDFVVMGNVRSANGTA